MDKLRRIIRETIEPLMTGEESHIEFPEAKVLAIQRAKEQIELEKSNRNIDLAGKWNEFIRKIEQGFVKDQYQLDSMIEDLVPHIKSEEDVYDFLMHGGL